MRPETFVRSRYPPRKPRSTIPRARPKMDLVSTGNVFLDIRRSSIAVTGCVLESAGDEVRVSKSLALCLVYHLH
jgi:hypothetical protein